MSTSFTQHREVLPIHAPCSNISGRRGRDIMRRKMKQSCTVALKTCHGVPVTISSIAFVLGISFLLHNTDGGHLIGELRSLQTSCQRTSLEGGCWDMRSHDAWNLCNNFLIDQWQERSMFLVGKKRRDISWQQSPWLKRFCPVPTKVRLKRTWMEWEVFSAHIWRGADNSQSKLKMPLIHLGPTVWY